MGDGVEVSLPNNLAKLVKSCCLEVERADGLHRPALWDNERPDANEHIVTISHDRARIVDRQAQALVKPGQDSQVLGLTTRRYA